jgi:DNA-directed RNA polymerase specialized sigma24 family protein
MPPRKFGEKVVSVLDDPKYVEGLAFGSHNARGGSGLNPGPSLNRDRRAELLALAGELRPDLHRHCARLMGSVIDGEDVVQDTLIRAFVALQDLDEPPPLRPWLFRIAHNRALDLRDTMAYVWMNVAGIAKNGSGSYEQAAAWSRRAIEANRNYHQSYFWLAAALAHLGLHDEARAAVKTGLALNPAFTRFRARAAWTAMSDNPAYLASLEPIFEGMRKAGVPEQ